MKTDLHQLKKHGMLVISNTYNWLLLIHIFHRACNLSYESYFLIFFTVKNMRKTRLKAFQKTFNTGSIQHASD